MKLVVGGFYRTRCGAKAGPMRNDYGGHDDAYRWHHTSGNLDVFATALCRWDENGKCASQNAFDIIAEWKEEPEMSKNPFIEEVTKKQIFEGYHTFKNGLEFYVKPWSPYEVQIEIEPGDFRKSELIELARILTELAEVME